MTDLMGAHKASLLDSTAFGAGSIFEGNSPVEAAQRYLDLDYAILPIKADGTKAPAAPTWSGDLDGEFSAEDCRGKAVGIKCGRLSDNAYCLDFEDVPTFDLFCAEVANAGLSHLIASAPLAATPRPGRHLYLHLLERPDVGEGLAWDADGKLILESRGQGQYVVAPGSPAATHKSGQLYQWSREPSEDKNYLAATEFEALIAIAKRLDQSGAHERPTRESVKSVGTAHDKNSPGHDYNARGDHAELLGSHGFKMIGVKRDGTELWQKPNSSDRGHQLTFNSPECPDMLYCFSPTCPPFPVLVPMDKFGIYARLEHNGDFKAAARQLGKEGYGDQKVVVETKKLEITGLTESPVWVHEDRPLFRTSPLPQEFPLDALGPILSGAAKRMREVIKAPSAICGQSVLAAASLAAQGRADIEVDGRRRPLSEFFITVGDTGERKSGVDTPALLPQHSYQKKLKEIYKYQKEVFDKDRIAWDAARKAALKTKDATFEAKREALKDLPAEPQEPLEYITVASEPTYEGLVKLLSRGQPSVGLFSDEGGRFLGGHAMNQENQLKTAAGLSKLWDGSPIDRVRSGDGSSLLYGRRVSMHLMLQSRIAQKMMSSRTLLDQGLLSRCLFAFPDSTVGTRMYEEKDLSQYSELRAYGERLRDLLEREPPLVHDTRNELEPAPLTLTAEAKKRWITFHDEIETEQKAGGSFEHIRGFASKAAEHALRLGGTLALIDNPDCGDVNEKQIERAITLVRFYLSEAQRLFGAVAPPTELIEAQQLYDWFESKQLKSVKLQEVYQRGPNNVRTAQKARKLLDILQDHGKVLAIDAKHWLIRVPAV